MFREHIREARENATAQIGYFLGWVPNSAWLGLTWLGLTWLGLTWLAARCPPQQAIESLLTADVVHRIERLQVSQEDLIATRLPVIHGGDPILTDHE